MIEFASKLPRMRGLRSLSFFDNKFLESPSAIDALLENILQNKSLENLHSTQFHHERRSCLALLELEPRRKTGD